MTFYECVFIARQDITPAQVDGLTETFEKIIADNGGAVKKTESWGLRSLAYKIKKNRKGHYVLMNIDAPAEAVHEMERQMRLNEDVLRNLTTRVDELEEGPSAVLRAKERGDERDRRGGRDFKRDDKRPEKQDDKPKAEAKKEEKTEAKAEPKAEAKAEPKGEKKAEPKAEAKIEAKDEAKAEAKDEPKAEAEAKPKAEAKKDAPAADDADDKDGDKDGEKGDGK